jgi:hypothetical protein
MREMIHRIGLRGKFNPSFQPISNHRHAGPEAGAPAA